MTSNGAYHGMLFRRHQHEFGTPPEALAEVAVAIRANAARNPNAVMQQPFTREEYFQSRYIVDPLRLLDYCLISDGGVAYIVTSLERARNLRQVPVRVLASAAGGKMGYFYGADDCWYSTLRDIGGWLFAEAGVGPADLDCAQIYDNFTPSVLFGIEGIGICDQGAGGDWLLAGNHRTMLPINTAGGHRSESSMQGWALTVEAVHQVRGTAGPRQIQDCTIALDLTTSPLCSANILAR